MPDEIFRVYVSQHPDIEIQYVNASSAVKRMILRAQQQSEG
jgi:hypothetical protein